MERKNFFKRLFGQWNLFELVLLFGSLLVVTMAFLLGKDKNAWSFLSSVSGIVCVLFTAKGNPFAQVLSIFFATSYAVLSYASKYYGETIIYVFLMIPIHVACIVSWLKNRGKKNQAEVKINDLSRTEYLLVCLFDALLTACFYFLLKALGTSELLVSTISLVSSVSAAYLMLRRSEYYAVCFIANDIILLVLWGLRMRIDPSCLPTLITFAVFLVNDAYGFWAWKRRKRKQTDE